MQTTQSLSPNIVLVQSTNPMQIYITPDAWHQAIATPRHCGSVDVTDRIGQTLQAACLAVRQSPTKTVVDFGVHRIPTDGNPYSPLWLDLQISQIQKLDQQMHLQISLKNPRPTAD